MDLTVAAKILYDRWCLANKGKAADGSAMPCWEALDGTARATWTAIAEAGYHHTKRCLEQAQAQAKPVSGAALSADSAPGSYRAPEVREQAATKVGEPARGWGSGGSPITEHAARDKVVRALDHLLGGRCKLRPLAPGLRRAALALHDALATTDPLPEQPAPESSRVPVPPRAADCTKICPRCRRCGGCDRNPITHKIPDDQHCPRFAQIGPCREVMGMGCQPEHVADGYNAETAIHGETIHRLIVHTLVMGKPQYPWGALVYHLLCAELARLGDKVGYDPRQIWDAAGGKPDAPKADKAVAP